jgi:hypothetical protein
MSPYIINISKTLGIINKQKHKTRRRRRSNINKQKHKTRRRIAQSKAQSKSYR